MLLPLAGLLVGVLLGLVLNINIGVELSRYSAVAILAALDSVLGGVRAELDGVYNNRIFISGFVTNAIIAVAFTFPLFLALRELDLAKRTEAVRLSS